ncbi:MAG TPA: 3-deoxy-manno-octulosonate cytidylyltransferase [Elusimicrobia bacterium]|nr:3-deoxy-manno-octulosonate cytidylyltransferase [Elusimicrobiota bacterium]
MKTTLVVIPARLASTRLPGKVLRSLGGRPVVEWCRQAALKAGIGPVVVATDHPEVLRAVEARGGTAVLTSEDCRSGTDRVHAALRVLERAHRRRYEFIVNLQGDEPFIQPSTVRGVAELLWKGAPMATAVVATADPREVRDPNVVKVALAASGRCLYFSRAPIPFKRPHKDGGDGPAPAFRHIGIYGYSRKALERFVSLPPSGLEKLESLEQLRALEDGMAIFACRTRERVLAIDTAADLRRASHRLKAQERHVA